MELLRRTSFGAVSQVKRREVKFKFRSIVVALSCVAGVACSSFAFGAKSHADMPEKLPDKPELPPIVSLELEPASLTLSDGRDARQVLVWGKTADGRKFDVTDIATFSSPSESVSIDSEDHYIHAAHAGQAMISVSAAGQKVDLPVNVLSDNEPKIRFTRDIEPLISRVGCNAGTCHGAAKGKNGFKLSLRGYDPHFDFVALTEELQGRRINRVDPGQSLMLLKPTGQVAHEGRTLFSTDSRQFKTIFQWIKEGAQYDPQPSTARPNRIEVLPADANIDLPGRTQEMIVIAHYPDGTTRDVTRDSVLSSNNLEVAKLQDNKITAIRRGEAAILVRYEGNYGVVNVSVMGDRTGYVFKPMPEYNFIDHHINAKLEKAKILPSAECTDDEFLRRVYLDLAGIVPTAAQSRAFHDDPAPSQEKRAKIVNKLIGSRDYIAFWSNKWADLLQCNSKALGERGVWVFREWIRQSIAQNKPYDQFAHELVTAQGSTYSQPATNYFLALHDTGKITEDVSQTFLGVRFNCNKCHDHPFERWTQDQYYEFGAFFTRVAFKPGQQPGEQVVFTSYNGGEEMHPRTGAVMEPIVPFGTEPNVKKARVRQDAFAQWLTSEKNPLFAKSYVNRVWSYFFGRGIIDPVDDIRASNPPVNPELLDALTKDFIQHHFDVEHLIRTIVSSRTYQLSVVPNRWNDDDKINFSHAIPRRLSAEQLRDAIAIATGTKEDETGLPAGMRCVYAADGVVDDDFLKLFGRPKRESACECERTSNVSLAHALSLVNGPVINDAVDSKNSAIIRLVNAEPDNKNVVDGIYYMVLNRPPTDAELAAVDLGKGSHRVEVAQDLSWALLNSPAFLFNR